jgi:Type IV secretion system pilin
VQNRLINQFKIIFAMLALFGMVFLMPFAASDANAQSGRTTFAYCLDKTSSGNGVPTKPSATGECPTADQLGSAPLSNKGICVIKGENSYVVVPPQFDANGKLKVPPCQKSTGVPSGTFYNIDLVRDGSVTYDVPPNTNTNSNSNSNSNSNTTPKNPAGSTGTTTVSGPCDPPEAGFHKVGPLCVPDSPFGKSTIAGGDPSPQGLAIKIIRIMLYMAAIVAVIMAIVGGYYVMTAGSNETQATNGRKTLINALVGLGMILLAYIIVQVVVNFFTK